MIRNNLKYENKVNLSIILEFLKDNLLATRLLMTDWEKKDGLYMVTGKEIAKQSNVATYETNFGVVMLSVIVNGNITIINTREQKIYSDEQVCNHFIVNTDDWVRKILRPY